MAELTVRNPIAKTAIEEISPAARAQSLNGKTIGLYWNYKQGGDVALQRTRELLEERFPDTRFVRVDGQLGFVMRHMTDAQADSFAKEVDAVVGTTSDCGSCTAWLIRDMIEMEKRGVPAVSLTSEAFIDDAHQSGRAFGMSNVRIATVPLPLTNQSPEAIRNMVDGAFDEIMAGLVGDASPSHPSPIHSTSESHLSFSGDSEFTAWDEMQRAFLQYGWSDGLPLVPPTDARVKALLSSINRDPHEIIAVMEPGFGLVTAEVIAANAVMAGCRPEHLPVVITAIECLCDPDMTLRVKAMSTGPAAPFILVNGPAIETAGINVGICALGPGSPSFANTVIGRAVRLCMMNVGGAYPGVTDMDTIGSPAKYSMCFGENTALSPWSPYHVERGFQANDSTVTVMFGYGSSDLQNLQSYHAEDLIRTYASAALNCGPASSGLWLTGHRGDPRYSNTAKEKEHHMILVAPDHAKIFGDAGWDKEKIRAEMFRLARHSFDLLMVRWEPEVFRTTHPNLQWLWESPESQLPVLEDPDCYDVVVLGGSAGRSTFIWGSGHPITKVVS